MTTLRHDWTIQEIETIYTAPLSDLVFRAAEIHRASVVASRQPGDAPSGVLPIAGAA